MLAQTDARFISKKEIAVNYNHRAGQLFEVTIKVQFSKIEKHLKTASISSAENMSTYLDMISVNKLGVTYAYTDTNVLENKITGIYEFGDCADYSQADYSSVYYSKVGKKIKLNKTLRTNFGKKRYVQNNGIWFSNRMF